MNGEDITTEIRNQEVTANVSLVCAYKKVREFMVDEQRRIASECEFGCILDGRDIGTVVFPNATLKIYLTASYDVRALRRKKEDDKLFSNDDFDFYDEETGMQVAVGGGSAWGNDSCLFFRNQIVEKYHPNIGMLRFRVNLLTEDAKDVLELSRNDVRPQARGRIRRNMIKSICRFVIKNYKTFKRDDLDYRPHAAALLELYRELLEDAQIDCNYPDDWKRLNIRTDQGEKTIKDLLKYDKIVFKFIEKQLIEVHIYYEQNSYRIFQ